MKLILLPMILFWIVKGSDGIFFNKQFIRDLFRSGALDLNIFRCMVANTNICPHPDVNFRMFTPNGPRFGVGLNIKSPWSLYQSGYNNKRESIIIIHGFNGTAHDKHFAYLRDAYLARDYNVVSVDWRPLTHYPCYITALLNTRLTAQCTAQIYSFITYHGTPREKITCIGHSLGAHICGMVSNHLNQKQYRIIGLDPARPLIERKKQDSFRLTLDDASLIQVVHTNAGFLGQSDNTGHLNYCINGGMYQPYCRGNFIRRARCSHFLSICYLANAIYKQKQFIGVPCPNGCVELSGPGRLPVSLRNPFGIILQKYRLGADAPDDARGCYCIDVPFAKHCPFTEIG